MKIDVGVYRGMEPYEIFNEGNKEITVDFIKNNEELEIVDVTFLKDLRSSDCKKVYGEFLFATSRACMFFNIEDVYKTVGRLLKDFDRIRNEFLDDVRCFYRPVIIKNKKE